MYVLNGFGELVLSGLFESFSELGLSESEEGIAVLARGQARLGA